MTDFNLPIKLSALLMQALAEEPMTESEVRKMAVLSLDVFNEIIPRLERLMELENKLSELSQEAPEYFQRVGLGPTPEYYIPPRTRVASSAEIASAEIAKKWGTAEKFREKVEAQPSMPKTDRKAAVRAVKEGREDQ